jgi:hypothetical protein
MWEPNRVKQHHNILNTFRDIDWFNLAEYFVQFTYHLKADRLKYSNQSNNSAFTRRNVCGYVFWSACSKKHTPNTLWVSSYQLDNDPHMRLKDLDWVENIQ